jgi:hypothetical protein
MLMAVRRAKEVLVAIALPALRVPEASIALRALNVEGKQLCLWIYLHSKSFSKFVIYPSDHTLFTLVG